MPSSQRYCCVCKNHGQKIIDGKKVSMHRFPANSLVRKVWIQRCKNARPNFVFVNADQTRLCSHHFVGKSGPTNEHPLPSMFPRPGGLEKVYKISNVDDNVESTVSTEDALNKTEEEVIEESPESSVSDEADGIPMNCNDSMLDISLKVHSYGVNVPVASKIRHQSAHVQPEMVSTSTQTEESLITPTRTFSTQIPIKRSANIAIQVSRPALTFDDVSTNDSKVLFYTGIPDSGSFKALFSELEDGISKQNDKGRPKMLRVIDDLFLVLMRLRLGLLLEDPSDRFGISTSTCGAIFNRWIEYLNVTLEFLVKWPSSLNINYTMPEKFRRKYPKCRVVIDCTEIFTETPCSLKLKSLLYSDYKSHMTYKSLIGISPAGIVTFVSDLYSGSTSDKQMTKLSGLVELCEQGDVIMVDKGFLISDLTTPKGVDLIIPPFKRRKRQFVPHEVEATKNIANLRIHVERHMERIKNFRIVQGVMPITMSSQSSKIWKTYVRLTNHQPPLVLDNDGIL